MAKGHCEGEGAGGGCAPHARSVKLKLPPFLQSEWEAKKRSL
jgi:hypothetical protein